MSFLAKVRYQILIYHFWAMITKLWRSNLKNLNIIEFCSQELFFLFTKTYYEHFYSSFYTVNFRRIKFIFWQCHIIVFIYEYIYLYTIMSIKCLYDIIYLQYWYENNNTRKVVITCKIPCKLLELALGPFVRYLCYKICLNHLLTVACNLVSDN